MNRPIAALVFSLATFAAPPAITSAGPVTLPSGLNPGEQYRLVFVTDTTRDATSSDITDYNSFVASAANSQPALAALGTTWTAIASTTSVSARDNTDTNPNVAAGVPIYNLDDTLFAASNQDLWTTAASPISIPTDSSGGPIMYTAWTGTTFDGVSASAALGTENPIYGSALSSLNAEWFIISQLSASTSNSFYAISGVLTVVPEPGTMSLACLAAAGLAVPAFRRRRSHALGLRTYFALRRRPRLSRRTGFIEMATPCPLIKTMN